MQPRWREKRASGPESEAAESTVVTHGSPVRDKTGSDPPLGALRSGITGRSCHRSRHLAADGASRAWERGCWEPRPDAESAESRTRTQGVTSWPTGAEPGLVTRKSFSCKGFRDLIMRTKASKR